MSSVLSLVAILSSLPLSGEAPASADGLLAGAGGFAHHDLTLMPLPASADAGNWAIDVRLGLDLRGLPSVEAVQLVRGLIGDVGAQKISVIEVAKLPDILADLIAKGDHFNVTPSTPATPTPEPVTAEPIPAPTEGVATPAPSIPTPAAPQPNPPLVEPQPVAQQPAAPQPATPAFATPDLVKQFIDYFIAHTGSVEIMVQGTTIVMFDAHILHDASAVTHLTSMTFNFADGGAISLVGNHSSFLNDGILV